MTNRSIYAKQNEAEGRGNCRQPAATDEGQAEANRRNGKTDTTVLTGGEARDRTGSFEPLACKLRQIS